MIQISIQDLKRHLSGIIGQAASGEPILITRHGKPVARLQAVSDEPHLHRGKDAGKPLPGPAITGRKLNILEILADDRRERFDT